MTCPHADILTRFADATLSDHEAADVVAHLAICEACSRKVEELEHRPEPPILAAFRGLQNVPPVIDADPPLPRKIAQYEIIEKIGSGGMGVVYRAVHPHLKREVALKVLRDTRLDDLNARERFVQEMQSLGKLTHPNIVHATDAGIDGDLPFIVTELLEGQDLGAYIEEHGKMSTKQAIDCIRQAATGLAYAHKAGYIHRDIKPSNLFLLRNDNIKILDLGIARPLDGNTGAGQTMAGHVVGSPEFMAPEQFRGGTADARSDVYSLGQTFLYMLTGKHDDVSGIPSRLKKILARMMAGAPSQRFQTADELLKVVDALTANERFKKNIALMTVGTILIIAAFIALRGSSNGAGSVDELAPVSEIRILENARENNPLADIDHNSYADDSNRALSGYNPGAALREFNHWGQPTRTVNENLGLDLQGRPQNNYAPTQYQPIDLPAPAPRNCTSCRGTGRTNFVCTFCKGTGFSGNMACFHCQGQRFSLCVGCKGTGKQ